MGILIEHHFLTTSRGIETLFENVNKISTFCRKLESQASIDPESYPYNKYVGDGFEMLIELLIKSSPTDNRIGISDYHPVLKNDNGVDGYGINLLGKKCAIQVKYRGNNKETLTSGGDNLSSFMIESVFEGVNPEISDKCKSHYIFTTAKGLHYYTDGEKFRNSVKCIGYEELRELVDNNTHFWNFCRNEIKKNLDGLNS